MLGLELVYFSNEISLSSSMSLELIFFMFLIYLTFVLSQKCIFAKESGTKTSRFSFGFRGYRKKHVFKVVG